jgi:hypothetical protein
VDFCRPPDRSLVHAPDGLDLRPRPLKPAAPRRLPKHAPDHIPLNSLLRLPLNLELADKEANGVQTTQPGQSVSAGEAAEFMRKDCVTVPEVEVLT